ncbi:hypothetical protein EYF80_038394 [Liparis tanakae]|uniref:Uncharacterized protein n=1 Tax=Liparis tanakae TaxID=230148 RepID=A0A4Z2GE02_9TELE|nr:hypothetical protein EYF80_038394 [Liparis tanakae]
MDTDNCCREGEEEEKKNFFLGHDNVVQFEKNVNATGAAQKVNTKQTHNARRRVDGVVRTPMRSLTGVRWSKPDVQDAAALLTSDNETSPRPSLHERLCGDESPAASQETLKPLYAPTFSYRKQNAGPLAKERREERASDPTRVITVHKRHPQWKHGDSAAARGDLSHAGRLRLPGLRLPPPVVTAAVRPLSLWNIHVLL